MIKRCLFFAGVLIVSLLCSCRKDIPVMPDRTSCNVLSSKMDTTVLLVMGQSNAANSGNELYYSRCLETHNFFNGTLHPLFDPLKGANGNGGSVWSRLGQMLIESSFAKSVIVAPVAIGGTSVQQWKQGGEFNHLIVETVDHLKNSNHKITHVLWHQGESNNTMLNPGMNAQDNAARYRTDFLSIVTQLRSLGVDAPVFVSVATRCAWLTPDAELAKVQRELANDSLRIYRGPDTDILGNEFRYDECHFNGKGLHAHASLWAEILSAH